MKRCFNDKVIEMVTELSRFEGIVFRTMKMEDGLMDVYLGIMLIPYALWIYRPDGPLIFSPIITPFLAFAVAYPVMMLMKKRVVTPRVGSIKPGATRRKKTNILVAASVVAVVLTVALVAATAFVPGSAVQLLAGIPRVFWIFSACVVAATMLTAWIASTPRLAIYGFLAAVSIPVDAVYLMRTGYPPTTLIPALVMMVTGSVLFLRFLNKYPVRAEVELG